MNKASFLSVPKTAILFPRLSTWLQTNRQSPHKFLRKISVRVSHAANSGPASMNLRRLKLPLKNISFRPSKWKAYSLEKISTRVSIPVTRMTMIASKTFYSRATLKNLARSPNRSTQNLIPESSHFTKAQKKGN